MLQSVIAEGTGYPNAVIDRPAAGKTGTTSDFRDAWFVGFTPDLVAAVWIGNDDYHRMNESYGGNIPARIWARFMRQALAKTPKNDFIQPANEVQRVAICAMPDRFEYFLVGTAPSDPCLLGGGVTSWTKRTADAAAAATPNPSLASPAGVVPASAAPSAVEVVTPLPEVKQDATAAPTDEAAAKPTPDPAEKAP
jgi:penicillin-binding protein 1A